MNPYIYFETALTLLAVGYLVSVLMLLAISEAAIAVIETIEKLGGDCN